MTDVTKAGARVGAAGHSLHAQALVGVQDRYRLYAGQQLDFRRLHSAMAPIAVNGDLSIGRIPLAPPTYLRTFGLLGGQPGATGAGAPSLHGPISAYEHPDAANKLSRGATADDIIGNRVYAAWGVGDDGVLTILDRKKLLPPLSNGRGGTSTRATA